MLDVVLDASAGLQPGLYIWGLCEGLEVVLAPYRHALGQIERQLMSHDQLTATHVQHQLEEVSDTQSDSMLPRSRSGLTELF